MTPRRWLSLSLALAFQLSHLALDAKGRVRWSNLDTRYPDNHDHVDSFRFADLDGDGELEALGPQSDVGIVVYNPRTGEPLWRQPAAHAQQVTYGRVLDVKPKPPRRDPEYLRNSVANHTHY